MIVLDAYFMAYAYQLRSLEWGSNGAGGSMSLRETATHGRWGA